MTRLSAIALIAAGLALAPAARADMVGTRDLLAPPADAQRARVEALVAREDVQRELESLGASPAEAERRVASLTEDELRALSSRVDSLPAGAGVSTIELLLIVIIIILLI